MPDHNTSADDKHEQAELIAEPRAEYKLTPEAQAEKETYRKRLVEKLKDSTSMPSVMKLSIL